jgi:hypothetical protein
MMLEGFLIGVIATCSAVAGLYFLRFWRGTNDLLFLAFGLSFLVEAANRTRFLGFDSLTEDAAGIYLVRLGAYLLILGAILHKNLRAAR